MLLSNNMQNSILHNDVVFYEIKLYDLAKFTIKIKRISTRKKSLQFDLYFMNKITKSFDPIYFESEGMTSNIQFSYVCVNCQHFDVYSLVALLYSHQSIERNNQ